ncbi:MAG TPA: cysteine peptidase family C39 domain-containing protein [Deltaproteobacteria bacterium]|nr:cysteine peptidase family C39 domain-containing protein [Deltaproteobacteria bacterium]
MTALFSILVFLCADAGPIDVDGVPFYRQDTNLCGPAALSSVLAYHGLIVDQKTIADAVYTDKLRGSLITDLENYAKSRGFGTRLAQGSMGDIVEALRHKMPVIVLVDMGFWVFSRPHYLVVTGWSDRGVRAHTGTEADRVFSREEFERIWARKGSVYLLVLPPSP